MKTGLTELFHGCLDMFECAFVFFEFCEKAGNRLSPALIQTEFECSRATSYRWHAAYLRYKARQQQLSCAKDVA